MRKAILFIHSAGHQNQVEGSTGLVNHLQKELGEEYQLIKPLMPEPENPRYKDWEEKLESVFKTLDNNLLIIGHSLGASVLLKFLSENMITNSIKAMFLISTPYWGKKDWKIEEFEFKESFPSMLPSIEELFLYHSKHDQWVPYCHLEHFAQILPESKVRTLEGIEHEFFNGLPQLVKDIKNIR